MLVDEPRQACSPKGHSVLEAERNLTVSVMKAMKGYAKRAKVLRDLGFTSYQQYLASDLWKRVKSKVFQIKGRSCELCGRPAATVHHNRYCFASMIGRRIKFLIPICHACHEEIEFDGDKKLSLGQARQKCKRRIKERRSVANLTALILNFDALP